MTSRWAWVEVDLDAIAHNVGALRSAVAPAQLWAVVKADGYGHGAVDVACTAVSAGASGLCVALVDEGIALRSAGVEVPILVLSEQPRERLVDLVGHRLTPTVYRSETVEALADVARAAGVNRLPVHLKVDTGMRRVGAAPHEAVALAGAVAKHSPVLTLEGVYTHLPCADEPLRPETSEALATFGAAVQLLREHGHQPPLVHAANSAAGLAFPEARMSLVRAGIAVYGIAPGPAVADLCDWLRPALSLHARVSFVKRVTAGDGVSYGLRQRVERDTTVATLPLGYADGVPRGVSLRGASVLIGGRRRPILGVVTMDQLMVDCGDDAVEVGDHAVLLGSQGGEHIGVQEWADMLATITYEIVCRIGPRVQRIAVRGGPSMSAASRR